MRRLLPLISAIVLPGLLFLSSCQSRPGHGEYYEITGYAQGGVYSVKLRTDGCDLSPEALKTGIDSVLTLIDTTLSGYNPASQLSRFNAGESIRPNELFLAMYERAHAFWLQSGGVLDFAAGPLFDAWGFGFREDGQLPDSAAVSALLDDCGMGRLRTDIRSTVREDGTLAPADLLKEPGTLPRLNYNAIAQGLSCDLVADYLRSHGSADFLVNIGEIYCQGRNPSGEGWSVGVDAPIDGNFSPGEDIRGVWDSRGEACGIVTSGNYRKFTVGPDGEKYVHTIDPRTGYPIRSSLLSATVTAPDAATADALATWCMVIGTEASRALIASLGEGYSCYLIYDEDGEMRTSPSPEFHLIRP